MITVYLYLSIELRIAVSIEKRVVAQQGTFPAFVIVMSQMNPCMLSWFLRYFSILSIRLNLALPSSHLCSGIPVKPQYVFLVSPIHTKYPARFQNYILQENNVTQNYVIFPSRPHVGTDKLSRKPWCDVKDIINY
jgi:hypothetical protein